MKQLTWKLLDAPHLEDAAIMGREFDLPFSPTEIRKIWMDFSLSKGTEWLPPTVEEIELAFNVKLIEGPIRLWDENTVKRQPVVNPLGRS